MSSQKECPKTIQNGAKNASRGGPKSVNFRPESVCFRFGALWRLPKLHFGAFLGRLGAVLEASGSVLKRFRAV